MKKHRKTLFFVIVFSLISQNLNAAPPKVIKTIPANGDQNVSPALTQITIEFDQDMDIEAGMSICGGGPNYPQGSKARWINKRTLVKEVKLKPNYTYELSINCPSYQNCRGVNGEPAEIYPLLFKTASGTARQNSNANLQASAVLLQQGIYAEETEGDLEKAMGIYTQIRTDYNDVERIAARATYQMGTCFLKKNDKESAAKYFQEVVDYFPDQKSVAEKAQQQLDKLGIKKENDKNIYDLLGQTSAYIGAKYGEACFDAGMKKLYSNSHIYVVDKNFVVRSGGLGYVYNNTTSPITGKHRIGGTTEPGQKFFDLAGNLQKTEIVPDENRTGFYQIYWYPKEPLEPNGFFNGGWATDGSRKLNESSNGYDFSMQNQFGDHCFETFFLAVPEGIRISNLSEDYTGKGNDNGWDIYWWKKEVPANTTHRVSLKIRNPIEYTQEIHYDIELNGLMKYYMPYTVKNYGPESMTNYQFKNSDFVMLTKIIDENNKPIEFTSTHQGSHFHYNVTFNPPIESGQEIKFTMSGTMSGLIKPVENLKDTYQYYMKHHPGASQDTLRIETYLLPQGAEVISTTPPTMKRTEKNGRIELSVEEVIPPGGSITTSFQYKLK